MKGVLTSFSSAGDLGSKLMPPSLTPKQKINLNILHAEICAILIIGPLDLVLSLDKGMS